MIEPRCSLMERTAKSTNACIKDWLFGGHNPGVREYINQTSRATAPRKLLETASLALESAKRAFAKACVFQNRMPSASKVVISETGKNRPPISFVLVVSTTLLLARNNISISLYSAGRARERVTFGVINLAVLTLRIVRRKVPTGG